MYESNTHVGIGSAESIERVRLANSIKGVVNVLLQYYEPKLLDGFAVVMRLDGKEIPIEFTSDQVKRTKDGGVVKIDRIEKIHVQRSQHDVKDVTGMIEDFHEIIR